MTSTDPGVGDRPSGGDHGVSSAIIDELVAAFQDALAGHTRPLPPRSQRETLGRLIRAHRLSSLLARTYDPADDSESPFHARLVEFHRACAARNLFGWHLLGRALDALDDAGVPSVVLKGAVLGPTLYGDPGLRPMSDIDLAVRPDRRGPAGEALRAAGFALVSFPSFKTDPRQGVQPVDSYVVYSGAARQVIELHWDLARRYDPVNFLADPLDRAVRATAMGRTIRTLDPTDTLHHLAIHLTDVGNSSQRLIWYADLALMAHRQGAAIDGRRLARDAAAWKTEGALAAAFSTLVHSLGSAREAFEPFAGAFLSKAEARPRDAVILSVPYDRPLDRAAEDASVLAAILQAPGLLGKGRILAGMLLARPEYMRQRYGIRRGGLAHLGWAYARRLALAAWRGVRALFGMRHG